jgi:O-acetylserine/cysteine efflux transporter
MSGLRASPQKPRLPALSSRSTVPLMRPAHLALAVLVAAIWGCNFVPIKAGLADYPPFLLVVLRFGVAAIPVLFTPFPNVPWQKLVLVGLVHFTGQFAFLFLGMAHGMPPGLASLVMQSQAFFTIFFAAMVLRERPSGRQLAGMATALAGLGLIELGVGGDTSYLGLALTLTAASCWAAGNILVRGLGKIDMLRFVIWESLVPILPCLALSAYFEGLSTDYAALLHPSLPGLSSLLYLGLIATTGGWAIWNYLLKLYPAGTVAPWSLLAPLFGAVSAALVYGETFSPLRLSGMALILVGLVITSLRLPRWRAARATPSVN